MTTPRARPRPRSLPAPAGAVPSRRSGRGPDAPVPLGRALLTTLILALPLAALLVYAAPSAAAAAVPAGSAVAARWVPPVQPLRVVRPFRPPPAPWAAGHRGVDLAIAPRGRVASAGAGTVTFAGLVAGRGVVVVQTGELRTTYEPVSASVRVGQAVRPGDPLGTVAGTTHCAPAVCLHWGLLRGETYLDPLSLLTRPAVRLLPLDGPVVVARVARPHVNHVAPRGSDVELSGRSTSPAPRPSSRWPSVPTPMAVGASILVGVAYIGERAWVWHSRDPADP